MRSVHTEGSTHFHLSGTWVSPTCLGASATVVGLSSFVMSFTYPPSCLPLLLIHYDDSSLLWRLSDSCYTTSCNRYPWFTCMAFLPFRLQPPVAPCHRFYTLPLSVTVSLLFLQKVWASLLMSKLAVTTGRIEFVILRTGFSPPVALHVTLR